jgi:hypothetical protein
VSRCSGKEIGKPGEGYIVAVSVAFWFKCSSSVASRDLPDLPADASPEMISPTTMPPMMVPPSTEPPQGEPPAPAPVERPPAVPEPREKGKGDSPKGKGKDDSHKGKGKSDSSKSKGKGSGTRSGNWSHKGEPSKGKAIYPGDEWGTAGKGPRKGPEPYRGWGHGNRDSTWNSWGSWSSTPAWTGAASLAWQARPAEGIRFVMNATTNATSTNGDDEDDFFPFLFYLYISLATAIGMTAAACMVQLFWYLWDRRPHCPRRWWYPSSWISDGRDIHIELLSGRELQDDEAPALPLRTNTAGSGISSMEMPPSATPTIPMIPPSATPAALYYITHAGKRFHSRIWCPGLNNAHTILPVELAGVGNRQPCKFCWPQTPSTSTTSQSEDGNGKGDGKSRRRSNRRPGTAAENPHRINHSPSGDPGSSSRAARGGRNRPEPADIMRRINNPTSNDPGSSNRPAGGRQNRNEPTAQPVLSPISSSRHHSMIRPLERETTQHHYGGISDTDSDGHTEISGEAHSWVPGYLPERLHEAWRLARQQLMAEEQARQEHFSAEVKQAQAEHLKRIAQRGYAINRARLELIINNLPSDSVAPAAAAVVLVL